MFSFLHFPENVPLVPTILCWIKNHNFSLEKFQNVFSKASVRFFLESISLCFRKSSARFFRKAFRLISGSLLLDFFRKEKFFSRSLHEFSLKADPGTGSSSPSGNRKPFTIRMINSGTVLTAHSFNIFWHVITISMMLIKVTMHELTG